MKNIRFIKRITDEIQRERKIIGDCVYYTLNNKNRVKAYCLSTGVNLEIINANNGVIDSVHLPFSQYFHPVQCSPRDRLFHQSICLNNEWMFESQYEHVLPKDEDYKTIAVAMEDYIAMFDEKPETCSRITIGGTIRRMDDLGRICIPKDIRKVFGKGNSNFEGQPFEILPYFNEATGRKGALVLLWENCEE